jgi:uronate dehydrogenase
VKILITGARGVIGSRLAATFEGEHDLRLLSRSEVPGDPRWVQADVTDIGAVVQAAEGVDAVIHLAIASGQEGDYEDDIFNAERFDTNVKGTYNVFEAARRAGVKRVIHTSSLTVVWGYQAPDWVEGDASARPVGTYALTKTLAERIAEHYAHAYGLSVVCLRIPKPIDINDPETKRTPILPRGSHSQTSSALTLLLWTQRRSRSKL